MLAITNAEMLVHLAVAHDEAVPQAGDPFEEHAERHPHCRWLDAKLASSPTLTPEQVAQLARLLVETEDG